MSEDLENIEKHLRQYEQRTHRPLHMDVLHVCSDLSQAQGEISQLRAELETERRNRKIAERELEGLRVIHRAVMNGLEERDAALRQCVEALETCLSGEKYNRPEYSPTPDVLTFQEFDPSKVSQALAAAKEALK